MLADAFEALKKYDWGTDLAALEPIDNATVALRGTSGADPEIESQLLAALKGPLSRDAHDYVCRKLAIVGTAVSVPSLAALLEAQATSHMARYALERINSPQAGESLRNALRTTQGKQKIGVITSLGARRDGEAVAALAGLLGDSDRGVSRAAALALGTIGSSEAADALQRAPQAGMGDKQAVIDGLLGCAESMLRDGKRANAQSIYESMSGEGNSRLIRLAATRGLLACADQNG
jgi:HEAT repeat protein